MSYGYSTGTFSGAAELFEALHTFLTTQAGWVLHDDRSEEATPYRVYSSDGESRGLNMYVKVILQSTTMVRFEGYRYWESTTHTGYQLVGKTSTSYGLPVSTDPFTTFFFGDKDEVWVVVNINGSRRARGFGNLVSYYSKDYALTQTAISKGSSVEVEVDTTAYFEVGVKYMLGHSSHVDGNWETVKVTSINAVENKITLESVANNHAIGASLGIRHMNPFVVSGTTTYTYWYYYTSTYDTSSITPNAYSEKNYTSFDMYLSKEWLWPVPLGTTYLPLGRCNHIYQIGGNSVDQEDTIVVGSEVYRAFSLPVEGSTAWWIAIRQE